MAKIALGSAREATEPDCMKELVVEFICTFLFVFAGVGSAMAVDKPSAGPLVGLFFVGMAHALVVETPVHTLASGVDCLQGVLMGVVLTFSLLSTVYATIVNPKKGFLKGLGPLLTGLLVSANIFAGRAFSGASMNPARCFGPPLVSGN
ncbi:MIP aquaporin (TC 1.A.8) [Ancistrocladus abbreviatus]